MSDIFISDLHLSPERPAITRAFFAFLEKCIGTAERLYILGDLVEVWIGDDDPSPLAAVLTEHLAMASKAGLDIYFIPGNRDFLVGQRFARQANLTVLDDYHILPTDGGNLLICHGDTLCTDDTEYQRFRRRVRHPLGKWLLRHLPLALRQRIARSWREKSRKANANKADNIMDVAPDTVKSTMALFNAVILVHGHTHRPAIHDEAYGRRVVLGDWDREGWFGRLEAGQVTLHSFPIMDSSSNNSII